MTREDAITIFKRQKKLCLHENDWFHSLEMAIKALEQEPCEDAISRQAVISIIQNWLGSDTGYSWGEKNVMLCTIDELKNLPSVSTEKTGRWIETEVMKSGYKERWICPECGFEFFHQCPNCGAKMEVEDADSD